MTIFLSKKQNLSNKGFTLVELIIVIAIIAILTAILVPNYVRYVEKSRWNRDRNQMETLINEVNTAVTYTLEEDKEVLSGSSDGTIVVSGNKAPQLSGFTSDFTKELNETDSKLNDIRLINNGKHESGSAKYTITVSVTGTDYSTTGSFSN